MGSAMKCFGCLVSIALALLAPGGVRAEEPSLVPLPKRVEWNEGAKGFEFGRGTVIVLESESARPAAELLVAGLGEATGLELPLVGGGARAGAIVFAERAGLPREAYRLEAGEAGVRIEAAANGGWFYGGQTLLQLVSRGKPGVVPAVTIEDEPAFPWRGAMLDVSRYFFTKDYVLRYLDMMAMHKLNVFHWHLVDDCGWRIEIKRYPKLTEVGGFRGKGEQRYGGFYTQDDIREVIAYAAARNIEVVPEIEVPAHTLSALCAYPELGCTGKTFEVPTRHSISPEIYCVGKEATWEFLGDVFDEVAELFPSRWIHIGGDEARYKRWEQCRHCQEVIRDQGLGGEKELQGWATRRLAKMLEPKGKRILGWSEVLEAGAGSDVGLMVWHKPDEARTGAEAGHPVVASFVRHTYFDTPESKLPGEPPAATWTPPVSLRMAYEWHPVPEGTSPEAAAKILGPNACLWSDRFLHNADQLADKPGQGTTASEAYMDYLSLPRLAALAEVGWTPRERRDFGDFRRRMETHYLRYLDKGYHFRVPTPQVAVRAGGEVQQFRARPPVAGATVHYTLDGSDPLPSSPAADGPVEVPDGSTFRAITVLPAGGRTSLVHGGGASANPFPTLGTMIGRWKSGEPGNGRPKEMTFDATGRIDRNGEYVVTFRYTGGRQRLDIDGIEVLRNDAEVVARDIHHGFTGAARKDNAYRVRIDDYQTGASFKIRAKVYGDTGDDSNGVVLIRRE